MIAKGQADICCTSFAEGSPFKIAWVICVMLILLAMSEVSVVRYHPEDILGQDLASLLQTMLPIFCSLLVATKLIP